VIKVERPGAATSRAVSCRIPNVDSLYFTMLNTTSARSRSTPRTPRQGSPDCADQDLDVLVENFGPAARPHGISLEKIQSINPKMIVASIKVSARAYEDCKSMRTSRSAPARGIDHRLPRRTAAGHGAQIGDSGTGLHLALASSPRSTSAPYRTRPEVTAAMQTACSISRASNSRSAALATARSRNKPVWRSIPFATGAARRQ